MTDAGRFNCICGAHPGDAMQVVGHMLQGHVVMLERYRNGRWRHSDESVSDYILHEMREKGEDTEAFVMRMEQMADAMEREANAHIAQMAGERGVGDG